MSHTEEATLAAFSQTRLTLIVSAGQEDAGNLESALQSLCQDYWYPHYCFIRHQGPSATDAEELTQGFFEQLLVRRALTGDTPE